jgi:hypothetical protein
MKYTDKVFLFVVILLHFIERAPRAYNYSETDEDLFLRPRGTFSNERLITFRRKYMYFSIPILVKIIDPRTHALCLQVWFPSCLSKAIEILATDLRSHTFFLFVL